ncbi:MAG: tRNA (adenosine(37)-N6)-threonylcarbamoyltransferase complex ATPase subunit type 1 TsaE [Pirellulales bacterium]
MNNWTYHARDLAATDALGRQLANLLPAGSVVALNGPLGAGKTRLVQALAAALGVAGGEVTSPTFVLINEYRGSRPIYHFDAYRLRDDDEFLELGPEEYFDGDGLALIEWAERVQRCLPRNHLEIRLETITPTERRCTLTAHGARYRTLLDQLAQAVGAVSDDDGAAS